MNTPAPNPSRRGFFKAFQGDSSAVNAIRPPWTDEVRLSAACTRCNDCITGCPEGVLVKGDGGFPSFDARAGNGECTFCGICAQVCEADVFDRSQSQPWTIIAEVTAQTCLADQGVHCEACRDICDARAIRMEYRVGGPPRPDINIRTCTGCGACVGVCPVSAINMVQAEMTQGASA